MKNLKAIAMSLFVLSGLIGVPVLAQAETKTVFNESFIESNTELAAHKDMDVEQVIDLVNQERANAQLEPLVVDSKMVAAAAIRVKESEIDATHIRPNGTSFSTALRDCGVSFRGAGENIAWGQKTAAEVVSAWMVSTVHRENILNENFSKIGVSKCEGTDGLNYWVVLFAY